MAGGTSGIASAIPAVYSWLFQGGSLHDVLLAFGTGFIMGLMIYTITAVGKWIGDSVAKKNGAKGNALEDNITVENDETGTIIG